LGGKGSFSPEPRNVQEPRPHARRVTDANSRRWKTRSTDREWQSSTWPGWSSKVTVHLLPPLQVADTVSGRTEKSERPPKDTRSLGTLVRETSLSGRDRVRLSVRPRLDHSRLAVGVTPTPPPKKNLPPTATPTPASAPPPRAPAALTARPRPHPQLRRREATRPPQARRPVLARPPTRVHPSLTDTYSPLN
jgi:hypothetical protein